MNLQFSERDLAFRDQVRAFLAVHLTIDLREASAANTATFCDLEVTRRWHEALYHKGWVAPAWPAEYGGPGWSEVQRYIFASECAKAGAPATFSFGTQMCGPVLMQFGTPQQKAAYLPKILSGEHRWCQGYSEPGAGSDLASLRTRATSDGDDYIVSGTKIWTTFAHNANWVFCLVRTDPDVKLQLGISFLLIDLTSPGVTVRPIVNIAGDHEFNEVFFDEVRVPKVNRVGAEGQGWTVAKHLLEFERGGTYAAGLWAQLERLKRAAGWSPADEPFRLKIAEAEIEILAVEMLERRALSALSLGESPGPVASVLKLQGSELMQHLDELTIEAAGMAAAEVRPATNAAGVGAWPTDLDDASVSMGRYLYNRSATIFGGTSEIQRNILARAALGF